MVASYPISSIVTRTSYDPQSSKRSHVIKKCIPQLFLTLTAFLTQGGREKKKTLKKKINVKFF